MRVKASELIESGKGAGYGDLLHGPSPANVPTTHSGTFKRIISFPGPAGPDVMSWGWGRSPASGLVASDKNPREKFNAPFNTVIIFSALLSGGGSRLEYSILTPPLQERCPVMASLQNNFLMEPKA